MLEELEFAGSNSILEVLRQAEARYYRSKAPSPLRFAGALQIVLLLLFVNIDVLGVDDVVFTARRLGARSGASG